MPGAKLRPFIVTLIALLLPVVAGPSVVRADGRATHAMYVFKVKAPQQSKSRFDIYDLIETIPPTIEWRRGPPLACEIRRIPRSTTTRPRHCWPRRNAVR
jgi:hypothetical protein